jgi:hypothetical protein
MDHTLNIRIEETLQQYLTSESNNKKQSVSQLVRAILMKHFTEKPSDLDNIQRKLKDIEFKISLQQLPVTEIKTLLDNTNKKDEKLDYLFQQSLKKYSETLSDIDLKISGQLMTAQKTINDQIILSFRQLFQNNNSIAYGWRDTKYNISQVFSFLFKSFTIFVLITFVGISFYVTGEYWSSVFSSAKFFIDFLKVNIAIFSVTFAVYFPAYFLFLHLLLKRLVGIGWTQNKTYTHLP